MSVALFVLPILLLLPGAVLFRLPWGARDRRAMLPAEERVFWYVTLSVAWTVAIVLALAALNAYTLGRTLAIAMLVPSAAVLVFRGRLRLGHDAPRPGWTAAVPLVLVVVGVARFFPVSEYVIGGKDPGTYVGEAAALSRTGGLVVRDRVVADVPEDSRRLFFPAHGTPDLYYSVRFMGFFVEDPAAGTVTGQFPHVLPASMAVAFDLAGIRAALAVTGWWGVLGLVALYFAGSRLVGRAAASAAALFLGLHVLQVWFARIPNAEIVMQPLVLSTVLALTTWTEDDDPFFAAVAGVLAVLVVFLRVDALLAVAAMVAAVLLSWYVGAGRAPWLFASLLAAGAPAIVWYLAGPMRTGFDVYQVNLLRLPLGWIGVAAAGLVVVLVAARRRLRPALLSSVPGLVAAFLILAGWYAWFLRQPGGGLTPWDASSLRTFVEIYFSPVALALVFVGIGVVLPARFWSAPVLVCVVTAFAVFVFYKMRIVPTHFWMGRRFLPVILPGALILAAAGAFSVAGDAGSRWWGIRRVAAAGLLAWIGWQFASQSAPIASHVEYAGLVDRVARLAARFGDRDLVIVESRDAGSDVHVLALPLAYVHGRNVLVAAGARPDKVRLAAFLQDASSRYERVFFLGGGGTDLLSRRIGALPVVDQRLQVVEYEQTAQDVRSLYATPPAWSRAPSSVRRKDFDYSVYELTLNPPPRAGDVVLDIGFEDDLHVVRFHAKEDSDGRRVRWTQDQSFVALPGLTASARAVVLTLGDGGRPSTAGPARVEVYFDDEPLGAIAVAGGFRDYTLALPPGAVARAAARDDPAVLRLLSTTWVPGRTLGGPDGRELGVMADRIIVR
jgi:hypothetical protein